MTRKRIREAYSAEKLAEIYAKPHHHGFWADHRIRVAVTIQLAHSLVGHKVPAIADLSCGDASIAKALGERGAEILDGEPAPRLYLGDYAPGYEFEGPLAETVWHIPHVDLYICSETLEHLDEPDMALKMFRRKADALILSTPVGAWEDRNPEHYWAWSREDVEEMLTAAGWGVRVYNELDCRPGGGEYAFGIWGCR